MRITTFRPREGSYASRSYVVPPGRGSDVEPQTSIFAKIGRRVLTERLPDG
jgi:hypothetical protein